MSNPAATTSSLLENLAMPWILTAGADAGATTMSLSPAVLFCVDLGLITISLGMLACVYRLIRGPHLADRSLAVDTFGIHLIGLVALLSLKMHTALFLDGILVVALLSFAGTMALAWHIGRPHLKRLEEQSSNTPGSTTTAGGATTPGSAATPGIAPGSASAMNTGTTPADTGRENPTHGDHPPHKPGRHDDSSGNIGPSPAQP